MDTFSTFTKYKGQPTIVGWIGGDEARAMEDMSNDEVLEVVWSHLSSIYPSLSKPDTVYVSRWGKEENFMGSYSHLKFGHDHASTSRKLAEQVGPISFAGEATAYPWYATTHGAWDSGRRGAKEMMETIA